MKTKAIQYIALMAIGIFLVGGLYHMIIGSRPKSKGIEVEVNILPGVKIHTEMEKEYVQFIGLMFYISKKILPGLDVPVVDRGVVDGQLRVINKQDIFVSFEAYQEYRKYYPNPAPELNQNMGNTIITRMQEIEIKL